MSGGMSAPTAAVVRRTQRAGVRGGFSVAFARRGRGRVPGWYGHCNGWTAAAIRHAEPQKSVVRNGVTFTPADIKGLLAELYMYSESEFLGGVDPAINPATLHLDAGQLAGPRVAPVGMETAVGEVVINYPDLRLQVEGQEAFRPPGRSANDDHLRDEHQPRDGQRAGELSSQHEFPLRPRSRRRRRRSRGGRYYGDSDQIDMLWTPLQPCPRRPGEEQARQSALNVKEVLAIWRESVPEDSHEAWLNVDPTEEDRVLSEADKAAIAAAEAEAVADPAGTTTPPAGTPTPTAAPAAEAGDGTSQLRPRHCRHGNVHSDESATSTTTSASTSTTVPPAAAGAAGGTDATPAPAGDATP